MTSQVNKYISFTLGSRKPLLRTTANTRKQDNEEETEYLISFFLVVKNLASKLPWNYPILETVSRICGTTIEDQLVLLQRTHLSHYAGHKRAADGISILNSIFYEQQMHSQNYEKCHFRAKQQEDHPQFFECNYGSLMVQASHHSWRYIEHVSWLARNTGKGNRLQDHLFVFAQTA